MIAPLHQDVIWKLEELIPESPKRDGSAEAYLHEIGKTPDEFMCDTLAITGTNAGEECFVCRQKPKTTKLCRINQNGSFSDISICTDCINVFVEYNPESVFNLKTKEK